MKNAEELDKNKADEISKLFSNIPSIDIIWNFLDFID